MKRIFFLSAVVLVASLTSCEKCTDCSCSGTIAFDFDDEIETSTQETIETAYRNDFQNNYPQDSRELCEKRGDFDEAVSAYEDESTTFTEDNTSGGNPWTVDAVYTCTCEE